MRLLSVDEYAEHRRKNGLPGTTRQAVEKAIKTGRISRQPEGIDPVAADAQWLKYTRPRADLMPRRSIEGTQRGTPPGADWGDHRARKESAEASLREIELEKRRGELIDRRGAELAWQKTARTLRDALLDTLPSKISLELAALTDPWAVECKLREALREELHAVADALESEVPCEPPQV